MTHKGPNSMATQTKTQKPRRGKVSATEQIARLRAQVARLRAKIRSMQCDVSPAPATVPELPAADSAGNYPATETLRAILAQQLVKRRQAAGLTQVELASRAGVRQETVSRLESGKNTPSIVTMNKLDRALNAAGG
jgi:DNA-binding XRE family transcriptional regulator